MIEQYHPVFDAKDRNAVADVIAGGWINEGPLTSEFECRFAEAVGSRYAVACANGTLALYMALSILYTPGNRLAIPATSAIGTVRAIQMMRVRFFVEDTFTNQPTLGKFRSGSINTSINGYFDSYPSIIEDACQSLGSRHEGKQIGTFSRIGCFSLATSKIITCGQGGVCVTDDGVLYEALSAFKDQGRVRDYDAKTQSNRYTSPGSNLKFDDIKAALALSQLTKLEERVNHKRAIYTVYKDVLGENILPMEDEALPWYPMLHVKDSSKAVSQMGKQGIQLKQFPENISVQRGKNKPYPNADRFHREYLYLPCSPDLSLDDAAHVAHKLEKVI